LYFLHSFFVSFFFLLWRGFFRSFFIHLESTKIQFKRQEARSPPKKTFMLYLYSTHPTVGSTKPECLGKSYSRKKIGRSDGFAGWLLLSLERWQLYVCISSQKRSPNQAQMDPWPSER
jgi:hypothetical protein